MVGEVCRRLGHAPGVAGWADAPALAGEGDKKVVPAVTAAGAGKAVRKDAALQIFLEGFAHIGFGAVVVALPVELARAGQLKPALVVLGHRLVEQRAFGVARVVELGLGCSRHEYCANTQYFADFSSAGLRSKNASMMRFAYTTKEN